MKRVARPLICLALSGVLASVVFQMSRDLAAGTIAAGERHTIMIALQICLVFAIALLGGVVIKDEDHLGSLTWDREKQAGRRWGVRDYLFLLCVAALEAALISCAVTFVLFSILDLRPPLQWGRVGGVFTDWVVDVLVILPLIVVGAFANGAFLASFFTRDA